MTSHSGGQRSIGHLACVET